MPSVLAATFPSLLGRMLEMPLSVLLCALEMCFLTVNHTQPPTTIVPINTTIFRIGLPQDSSATNMINMTHPHVHHVQRVPPVHHTTEMSTEPQYHLPSTMTEPQYHHPSTMTEPQYHRPSSMTDRLDAINMDMVLKNTRLVNSFVKCMLDKGPCTAEGREMKREMLEVLHTGCSNCSDRTKTRLKKTYRRMRSDPHMRESYKKVLNKYDPHRKYISNLEQFLIN